MVETRWHAEVVMVVMDAGCCMLGTLAVIMARLTALRWVQRNVRAPSGGSVSGIDTAPSTRSHDTLYMLVDTRLSQQQ